MQDVSDIDLVARARTGDREAFGVLADRHRPTLTRLARTYLRGDDWEDVIQEVLAEAWLGLASLRDPERLGEWLRGITRHKCLSHLRRGRRTASHEEISRDGRVELRASETWYEPPPDAALEQAEEDAALREMVESLPDKSEAVLTQHYLQDLSYEQIAANLRVSVTAIEGRLYRARRQLREEILKMARADIDDEALKTAIANATAGLRDDIRSLKDQLHVVSLEADNQLDQVRSAAARDLTRLPTEGDQPITWGIVGAFRLGTSSINRRIAMWTTDVDDYLSGASDDEIARFCGLFADPKVVAVLRALVTARRLSAEELARQCDLGDRAGEVLDSLETAGLIARHDRGSVEIHGEDNTYLLTLISLARMYLGRAGEPRDD